MCQCPNSIAREKLPRVNPAIRLSIVSAVILSDKIKNKG